MNSNSKLVTRINRLLFTMVQSKLWIYLIFVSYSRDTDSPCCETGAQIHPVVKQGHRFTLYDAILFSLTPTNFQLW